MDFSVRRRTIWHSMMFQTISNIINFDFLMIFFRTMECVLFLVSPEPIHVYYLVDSRILYVVLKNTGRIPPTHHFPPSVPAVERLDLSLFFWSFRTINNSDWLVGALLHAVNWCGFGDSSLPSVQKSVGRFMMLMIFSQKKTTEQTDLAAVGGEKNSFFRHMKHFPLG